MTIRDRQRPTNCLYWYRSWLICCLSSFFIFWTPLFKRQILRHDFVVWIWQWYLLGDCPRFDSLKSSRNRSSVQASALKTLIRKSFYHFSFCIVLSLSLLFFLFFSQFFLFFFIFLFLTSILEVYENDFVFSFCCDESVPSLLRRYKYSE